MTTGTVSVDHVGWAVARRAGAVLQSTRSYMKTHVHFYDPAAAHGLPHDPFKAIVAPRVIGWIASRSATGQVNLAPYTFFGVFSS